MNPVLPTSRKGRMAGESSSLTQKISNWLIRWRWPLLVTSLLITFVSVGPCRPDQVRRLFQARSMKDAVDRFFVGPATQLLFDAAIVNLFPSDDPVLVDYQRSLRLFRGAELVVVAYADPELLTADGLKRLKQFSDTFRDLNELGVEDVASLADGRWPLVPLDARPLYEQVIERDLTTEQLRETLCKSEIYRNLALSEDGQTTAVGLTIRPKRDDLERKKLIAAIRERARRNKFPTAVAGGPMLTHDSSVFVDQDSRTLGWTSTLALLVVLGVLFRRLRWVVLPLAVVHVTLVWTKALLWLTDAEMSMVSTTLTALVTVIGVAAVVQVTARYREERERADSRDALLRTMTAAGPAVFWASLTTAAGFASLLITSIVPVQNFAIMLSLASSLVFLVIAALVPAAVLFGRRLADPAAAPGERWIEHALEATMDWSLRRPWQVTIVAVAMLAFTVAGIFRIRAETDFTRNFRRSSEVVRAFQFVEQRLGGVGTLEVQFTAPDGITPELVDCLRQFETRLRENRNLTKVLGLVDVLDFFDVGEVAAMARMLPPNMVLAGKLKLLDQQRPDLLPRFWNEEAKVMRVNLLAREQEPSEVKVELLAFIKRTADEVFAAKKSQRLSDVRVTGVYTLLHHLVSGLMSDQLNTFLLATAAVFTIMCIALRSIKLGIVGLVPKLGPVLMVLGAMGWLGVPIDMGTPMIASVSVGISVGFSIHYLVRYRQERVAGVSFDEALRATHRRVGGAMVFSNLALVVGFAVLALSNFIPTVHFSLLADVALVGGLAGNLLVLPLLLRLVAR